MTCKSNDPEYVREYMRIYYSQNRDRLKQASRDRYAAKRNDPVFRSKVKQRREQQHFGMSRDVILAKTNGLCARCGQPAKVIHHIDGDGRTIEKLGFDPGKNPERLEPLCRSCHAKEHYIEMKAAMNQRYDGRWARHYDSCVECGTTDRKHNGIGLCLNCYSRYKRHIKS